MVLSIAFTRAPSSNTLLNLTTSPFGPANSTLWTNGLLASPAFRPPTSYRSKTLEFSVLLYMQCVSEITTTSLGKAPSPRIGVYNLLACLDPSPGSGSSCSGTSTRLSSTLRVVNGTFCSTSTTPPLFPGSLAAEGMQARLLRRGGLCQSPQRRD